MSQFNRENLYRILSPRGNPQLSSLNALLHSMGLRLAVEVDAGSRCRPVRTPSCAARAWLWQCYAGMLSTEGCGAERLRSHHCVVVE